MALGDDKIVEFAIDNYAAFKMEYLQKETCPVPGPTDIDCDSTSEFLVHKALMSFTTAVVQVWVAFCPKFRTI